jgi:phosphoribosyl 1,2-cyclic phosphodiesterase
LSNQTAGEILSMLDRSRLQRIVGAHLSQQNNTPALARQALEGALGGAGPEVMIACQADGFDWVEIAA